MYSVVLEDHESKDLYIAEVQWEEDEDRILDIVKQLNNEYQEETNEWDDFYVELCNRSWLKIYMATVLSV